MAKYLVTTLLVVIVVTVTSEASVFTVGDSAGWDISADLQSWTENNLFKVGDVLLFQYSRYQNLTEIDKAGYDSCDATSAIRTASDGNTTVALSTAGKDYYFISGRMLNCLGGMKLRVNVQGGNSTTPAASAEPPSSINGNDNRLPSLANGFLHGGRRPVLEAWLCTIGALLWTLVYGI